MGAWKICRCGGGTESVELLGGKGVGDECHRVSQEIWDDATCGEHLGQEKRKPGQRKRIDASGQIDIYEFMAVPSASDRYL